MPNINNSSRVLTNGAPPFWESNRPELPFMELRTLYGSRYWFFWGCQPSRCFDYVHHKRRLFFSPILLLPFQMSRAAYLLTLDDFFLHHRPDFKKIAFLSESWKPVQQPFKYQSDCKYWELSSCCPHVYVSRWSSTFSLLFFFLINGAVLNISFILGQAITLCLTWTQVNI